MTFQVLQGDCVELMAAMPSGSVDAVVCDPPYLLGFMGRSWDMAGGRAMSEETRQAQLASGAGWTTKPYGASGKPAAPVPGEAHAMQERHQAWAVEALRVLKPGGHLLAFGGTRTVHRLACAVEDAGFEIRDTICWMYGSGFPKSLDVSKAIDRAAGAEREVVGSRTKAGMGSETTFAQDAWTQANRGPVDLDITAPATPEAERWEGFGTALKPSHEPVVVARKPLSGTVAATVLEHGTGALNIDATRIEGDAQVSAGHRTGWDDDDYEKGTGREYTQAGRWPANCVLDEEAARLLDEQTGELPSGGNTQFPGRGLFPIETDERCHYAESGGASRFMKNVDWKHEEAERRAFYCAKASRSERNAGLEGFEEGSARNYAGGPLNRPDHASSDGVPRSGARSPRANGHPTVKPISLMRWLVRLVTPPGGTICDPFCGSGSTGCAAVLEGFDFVGLEREQEYVAIANARIAWWLKHRGDGEAAEILAAGELRDEVEATGQSSLF